MDAAGARTHGLNPIVKMRRRRVLNPLHEAILVSPLQTLCGYQVLAIHFLPILCIAEYVD